MKIFLMAAINKISPKTYSPQIRKMDEPDKFPLTQKMASTTSALCHKKYRNRYKPTPVSK